MAIVNPTSLQSGTPVRVRRDGGESAHMQFETNPVNRPYGASLEVTVQNELGAFLLALADGAGYQGMKSLASTNTNYMRGALARSIDGGVVFTGEFTHVPTFARPYFSGGVLRVGFTDDAVPEEVLDLL